MEIHFLGADRQVTASRHALDAAGSVNLVDCGLYQERPYLDRNWDVFPIPPEAVETILLTHAHLDHCGFIPRFVRDGFAGRVLATAATIDLARIVLVDAAHIQEEDAAFKKKRHAKEGRTGPHPEVPLYTVEDARASFARFDPVEYLEPVRLKEGLTARFHDAGHILGSAMISIDAREGGLRRSILFSGDIGQWNKPIVHDPSHFAAADYVVMESTYADRDHADPGPIEDLLAAVLSETAARGGNVLIPVFALERAQELLYYIARLVRDGRIRRVPVFLDSPMAIEATEVFARYPELLDPEARAFLTGSDSKLFDFPGLRFSRTVEESKSINDYKGPCVILAGSGMCNAGRIKHHLGQNIERPECTVLFVGYQAVGTLGRQIVDGRKQVRIHGRTLEVGARIARIHGFSGHADRSGLLRWLDGFEKAPRRLFLTHGEENGALDLAEEIRKRGWTVAVPEYLDSYTLD
jgi:metallo-beta-lactamase family protein